MKRVLIVVALIICAAVLGLWRSQGGVRAGLSRVVNGAGDNNSQGVTGDETRKTFDLKPGARIAWDVEGHRLVGRPLPKEGWRSLIGKHKGGPDLVAELLKQRREDREREDRKLAR